ncbi:hypothetical protein VC218_07165 [Xanthomonas nasturtii]|uniref:hypothetical protein n=1 Tax=Xanthomonas nasturtii TaxID=1843581 RepID=UPI002B233EC6|nr:hypothetical protein [Xanthomonas nasturtii]MEA9578701.1 hypothetical protein [Xanthomonas nasturtii]
MASPFLDSKLHTIARHLKQVDNRVDVDKEIEYLNKTYNFVQQEHFEDFRKDVKDLYEFERDRKLSRVSTVGFARFKLDQVTGNAALESHDAALDDQLGVVTV